MTRTTSHDKPLREATRNPGWGGDGPEFASPEGSCPEYPGTMTKTWTLEDVMSLMEGWYPAERAESWDRVGLILGDPGQKVERILLAVDPVEATVSEAIDWGADLLLTHHPLYLRGTSFIPESDPKGRSVARLIRANIGLFNAHTNADASPEGVGEALGALIGLKDMRVLVPMGVDEEGRQIGHGRIGSVEPMSLEALADRIASVLPAGPTGLLLGGDLERIITRVAVSGGAGDSFLEDARRAGAHAFLTADLRHHPASEHLEGGAPALLAGSHWATEWPWLPLLKSKLDAAARLANVSVDVKVSTIATEPWISHRPTRGGLK